MTDEAKPPRGARFKRAERVEDAGPVPDGRTAQDFARAKAAIESEPTGWVYLIREAGTDFAKVGYAVDHPEQDRLVDLQTGNPRRLRLAVAYRGSTIHEAEARRTLVRLGLEPAIGEWLRDPRGEAEQHLFAYFSWLHRSEVGQLCPDCGELCNAEQLCSCGVTRFELP